MKKSILVVLVMAFLTLMAGVRCFADVTFVTDTSKEGSLLIFPLIQTNDGNETYIFINHSSGLAVDEDGEEANVSIKCFWEVRDYPYVEGDGPTCPIQDTGFVMSVNNPLLFKASTGTGLDGYGLATGIGVGKKGILKCWVVDPGETNQIAWNYLSGYAVIVRDVTEEEAPLTSAWKYSAWRFAANVVTDVNGTTFGEGFWVGKTEDAGSNFNLMKLYGTSKVVTDTANCPAGTIPIPVKQTFPTSGTPTITYYCTTQVTAPVDCATPGANDCCYPYDNQDACYKPNAVYDACPTYLTFDFLAEPNADGTGGYAQSQLALAPCREDLRGNQDDEGGYDFNFPTRLSFEVWNENEVKYTGTETCVNCNGPEGSAYQLYLKDLNKGSINYFTEDFLHTSSGRFRVQGLAGGKCNVYDYNEVDGTRTLNRFLSAKKTPLVGVMGSQLVNPASADLVGTGATASGPKVPSGSTPDTLQPAWIKWDPSQIPSTVPERRRR